MITSLLTEIIQLLVGGITELGKGIGSGLNNCVTSMFLTTTGDGSSAATHLSVFGGIVVIFAAIALAVGLTKLVYHFVTSLGGTGN